MTEKRPSKEDHKKLAVNLFNLTWSLLDRKCARAQSGKIVEFVKVKDKKVVRRFKVEEIAHFHNSPKKGPYGRSQIELLVPALKKEVNLGDIPEL